MIAVEDDAQRDAALAAAAQLSASVGDAIGGEWPIRLRLIGPDDAEIPQGIVLVATIADRDGHTSIDDLAQRWSVRVERYRAAGHHRVLLCGPVRQAGQASAAPEDLERLRRLKHLVIAFSRQLGTEVVDGDRLLALCGLRRIAADARGGATATAQLVGHAIVDAILDGDLGDCIEAGVQARARDIHGGVRDIPRLMARRLVPGPQL
ncbi:MAG: hypothetical protein KKE02_15295 [Alphaproteobacteria bacterium]|nr:hypothetical protein [Alphaproteobacteria bacterium]MBU1516791.1 hypothetical protein [Alphaproteobacteria bacterium]MBU2092485.1 hypothetical protein [Alphaproteobacteria bacterium]MBU2152384.1 hypothetical protein [Alphaproteobacteria bacterium]MBU2305595.1 hypothetical protein [Alphaproteobacteria bacterium]